MEIVYKKTRTTIGTVSLDASVSEVHSMTGKATSHPVETGGNISDHFVTDPRMVRIQGMISNHPIDVPETQADGVRKVDKEFQWKADPSIPLVTVGGGGLLGQGLGAVASALGADIHTGRAKGFEPKFDRVQDALAELDAIWKAGRLIEIYTTLRVYRNMVIESLEIQRDAQTGNALSFTALAKQVQIVETELVLAPPEPEVERGKPEQSRGKKPGDEAGVADSAAGQSIAAKIADGLGGWF